MNCMLKNKTILLLLSVVLMSGCGYRATNTQIRDVAFLKFNKSLFKNYTVIVNDKYQFELDACSEQTPTDECHDNTFNKLYEIRSGNSIVKVLDSDKNLILEKEVYIGSSNTVEVNLPWEKF